MSLLYTNKPGKRRPFCLYKTVTYEGRTAQSRKFDTDDDDDDDDKKKICILWLGAAICGPSNKELLQNIYSAWSVTHFMCGYWPQGFSVWSWPIQRMHCGPWRATEDRRGSCPPGKICERTNSRCAQKTEHVYNFIHIYYVYSVIMFEYASDDFTSIDCVLGTQVTTNQIMLFSATILQPQHDSNTNLNPGCVLFIQTHN